MTQQQKLIPCREHCWKLAEFLLDSSMPNQTEQGIDRDGNSCSWNDVAKHLMFAASTIRVEVDTTLHDDSAWICRGAWQHEMAKSQAWSTIITELTMFNFIWNALENTVAVVRPRRTSGSVIDAACGYIKEFYGSGSPVELYQETLTLVRSTLASHGGYRSVEREFNSAQTAGGIAMGLHVVRRIRNRLAHGTYTLPLIPNLPQTDIEILKSSSRLLLFSIQYLVIAFSNKEGLRQVKDEDESLLDVEANVFLRTLHLEHQSAASVEH